MEEHMAAKKPVAVKKAPKRQDASLTIRCSPEWREWIEAAARFLRTDVSKLTDVALMDYMKARGFDKPAPER